MESHRGISLLLLVIYNCDIFALAAVVSHPTRNLFILGMTSPTETDEMKQTQTCVEPAKHAEQQQVLIIQPKWTLVAKMLKCKAE